MFREQGNCRDISVNDGGTNFEEHWNAASVWMIENVKKERG